MQPLGVGEAAQVVDAGQVGAGDVEAARLGAGGEQQLVVVDDGAVVAEPDGLGRRGRCATTGWPRCSSMSLPRVPGGLVDEDAVALLLAEQIALGQRGAFVGVVALVADQYHPAGEALRPERLGRLRPGQPSADDDECLMCVDHLMPPRSAVLRVRHATCERPARSVMRGRG